MSRRNTVVNPALICAILCLAFYPAIASAQAPIVRPGDPAVDGSRIRPRTIALKLSADVSGQIVDLGTLTLETTALEVKGDSVWRVVQKTEGRMGSETDTVIVARQALMPRSAHEITAAGSTILEYKGATVGGEHRDPEGSAQAIAQTLPGASFDSGTLDLVLAALPLTAGYTARLPMYSFEVGPHSYDVKVGGEVVIDGVAAWSVDVTMPEGVVNYAISKADNGILSAKATSGVMMITMTRVKT